VGYAVGANREAVSGELLHFVGRQVRALLAQETVTIDPE
jgi:hypothetical protein